jgi:hypothetical protein
MILHQTAVVEIFLVSMSRLPVLLDHPERQIPQIMYLTSCIKTRRLIRLLSRQISLVALLGLQV